ncbi:uncharacterized protein LOC114932869 [Nylanderia fulva]|uniref:uncharacterized protein LOC114932869 n=1 Tax=Nylanderia fulva TaxID=613905 RepID=UPI0010FB1F72|nr:uncharacterized protein LOC114932869 [Nylanderia fulva]
MDNTVLTLNEYFLLVRADGDVHSIDGKMFFHYVSISGGSYISFPLDDSVIQRFKSANSCEPFTIIEDSNTAESSSEESFKIRNISPLSSEIFDKSNKEIWVKNNKPSPLDIAATHDLIEIVGRKDIQMILNDKKTVKKKIWEKIGVKLKEKYNFGTRDEGSVCSQKWRNLESAVMHFLQNGAGSSGNGKGKKPAFYDERYHLLITSKEQPATIPNAPNSSKQMNIRICNTESENASSNENDGNPFIHVKSSTKLKKPRIDNTCILDFLKNEAEERCKQNESLMKLMQDSNDTKKAFLNIITNMLSHNTSSNKTTN